MASDLPDGVVKMSIPAVSDSTIRPRDTDSKSGYRVTVRGALPADLTQRISALHARAILERLSRTSVALTEILDSPTPPYSTNPAD